VLDDYQAVIKRNWPIYAAPSWPQKPHGSEERRRLLGETHSLKEAQQKLQQDLLSATKEKADASARLEERSKTTTASPVEDSEAKTPRVKASGRTKSAPVIASDTTETGA